MTDVLKCRDGASGPGAGIDAGSGAHPAWGSDRNLGATVLNTVFVSLHAAAATVAFVAGFLAVPAGRFLGTCRAALVVMTAVLVPAVLVDWADTDPVARGVFGGLFLLAGIMVVRSELAVRSRPERTGGVSAAYLGHLGFTLIALADGFAVVAAIRAGAPGWLVGAGAVGVVAAGHAAIQVAIRRLVVAPTAGMPERGGVHPLR
jgi:hypothetical protein